MAIIECIAHVSEGRRAEVIDACGRAITNGGARLLDVSADAAHHRAVFTFAGTPAAVKASVLALFDTAVPAIDLRNHSGVHPRIGAVDVVPFVPISNATLADCATLARAIAVEVAERHQLPIYLYGDAAATPARQKLEDIRRGQFEGLAARLTHPDWAPDYGPATAHPTAGATAIGARLALIAYNINLATDRLDVARAIARAVRESSGGFRHVKAMGVPLTDRGIVQVSMNLTDHEQTPMHRVFEFVRREAARHGVHVLESEIIGLVPSAAVTAAATWFLQLGGGFGESRILERRLADTGVSD
jgi:glutamate formiminotransferase